MKHLITAMLTLLLSIPALALEVGDKAPNFSLQASDGRTYTLEQFHNKQTVVIAWFPKAFTSGCTVECKSLAENGQLIEQYNAAYFMASTDKLDVNTKFAEEQGAKFPLLSDPDGKVADAYDVLIPLVGIASRKTIYIGKDGTILKIDSDINPATSAEDIAKTLQALSVEKRS